MHKIIFSTPCFYPSVNTGGPAVSMTNLVSKMSENYLCSVITPIYEMGTRDKFIEVVEGKNSLYNAEVYYSSKLGVWDIYSLIKKLQPDIIYVSSLFSFNYSLSALLYKKLHKHCKVIIAPRGELRTYAMSKKTFRKKLYIGFLKLTGLLKNVKIHTTSDDEFHELEAVGLKLRPQNTYNIANLSVQKSDDSAIRPYKAAGALKILTVGRFAAVKNIHYAIEVLSSLKGNIELDIYGPKEDENYFESCFAIKTPNNIKVNYKGILKHDDLEKIYLDYHLFLSPTLTENFGHSIVEALLNHCPVIISNNTPWNDVADYGAGYAIDLNEKDSFAKAITEFVEMNDEVYQARCLSAKNYIQKKVNTNNIVDNYYSMFDESML